VRQVMGPGSGSLEMSTSSNEAFKFAKLNGENYALWFQHMQSSLQARYLWLIVTGDEPCPEKHSDTQPTEPTQLATWKATKKEWLDWSLRDQAAQGLIRHCAFIGFFIDISGPFIALSLDFSLIYQAISLRFSLIIHSTFIGFFINVSGPFIALFINYSLYFQ
jgi:hypothetical protein